MIPTDTVGMITARYEYYHERKGDEPMVAMTRALHDAFKEVCTCGEPLMLGMVHHKNAPCIMFK
jgi:hypothetical protein